MDTNAPPGLGEALARVKPKSLDPALWARLREEALAAILATRPRDPQAAKRRLSQLCAFLADVAPTRPDRSLAELVTREEVEGHLKRAADDGASRSQFNNRRATLNAIHGALNGLPPPRYRRREEPHRRGYHPDEVTAMLALADDDASPGAQAFSRMVVCALAGVARGDAAVQIASDGHLVVTADGAREVPGYVRGSASMAGPLNSDVRRAARRWVNSRPDVIVDARRLDITGLAWLATNLPAIGFLRLSVGRDRFTAAMDHTEPLSAEGTRVALRSA